MSVFAQQTTKHGNLSRIRVIGHPAREGFEQHFNRDDGTYAGYVTTVNNWGLSYRAYPSKIQTGRLFDKFESALDYLIGN